MQRTQHTERRNWKLTYAAIQPQRGAAWDIKQKRIVGGNNRRNLILLFIGVGVQKNVGALYHFSQNTSLPRSRFSQISSVTSESNKNTHLIQYSPH